MSSVVISPYAKLMRNGREHPKNYPYWKELVALMNKDNISVIQIGMSVEPPLEGITEFKKDLDFSQIKELIKQTDTWISVDTFLQHLCAFYKLKRGIVLWGQSDPRIFGYSRNINLLKDKIYLRDKQFWWWEQTNFNKDAFVTADKVYTELIKILT